MFLAIEEYILKSREERFAHLVLQEPCIEIGGTSKQFRGLLAHFVKTTIPRGRFAMLLHACHNGKCSNVRHLYWGSTTENTYDHLERSGRRAKPRAKKNSPEHIAKVRAALKIYYSDPEVLARQRAKMAHAQSFRKCFQRV